MRPLTVLFVLWLAIFHATLANDHRVRSVKISGRVTDDETNAPIQTALTILQADFNTMEVTTNTQGEFSITVPESKECKITVRAKGFEAQDDIVSLAPTASHYVEIRLIPFVKLMMSGDVISMRDKKPISAEVKVFRNSDFDQENNETFADGKFTQPLINFGFYVIDFSAKGYVDMVDTVWVLSYHRKTLYKNVELKPIEKGLTLQLKNIYFNFGKASLSPDSFTELDRLIEFFSQNPSTQVEIAGHTDSDGPDDYNLILSQARAQEVVNYLKSKGVNGMQLSAKGYGETKPIDSNLTMDGKANNRRVEMIVIKN